MSNTEYFWYQSNELPEGFTVSLMPHGPNVYGYEDDPPEELFETIDLRFRGRGTVSYMQNKLRRSVPS